MRQDANKDGQVTFEEMCSYFTVLGAELDDTSFSLIVGEMVDAASTQSILKTAAPAVQK